MEKRPKYGLQIGHLGSIPLAYQSSNFSEHILHFHMDFSYFSFFRVYSFSPNKGITFSNLNALKEFSNFCCFNFNLILSL